MKHRAKIGDVFQLGDHRLACGDCFDEKLIEKLMGDGTIRMVLTDPPYGVAYVENKKHFKETIGSNIAKPKIIENDHKQTTEEYAEFTQAWIERIKKYLDSYNTFYIFNSDLMMCALRKGMEQADIYYSQMIIWIKNCIVVGRKDYLPQHELIVYGWYGRHKLEGSKGKSVIFHNKPSSSKLHPTMKPIGLLRKLMLNSTKIGETIYDPFGGSGSTLMACEHIKRKCYMVELDIEYCDTIIARWEKLTNKEAKLISCKIIK